MDELRSHNTKLRSNVEAMRDEIIRTHSARKRPAFANYPLVKLQRRIADALSQSAGTPIQPQLEVVERGKFDGDVSIKFPSLLANGGPKKFIEVHLPSILEVLSGEFGNDFAAVRTKGMYINVTLSERWFLEATRLVAELGQDFGTSDAHANERVLVEYSSPNIAKVLHAGHIRSTIIGHVLANLYEACGALVYRVNHINDFGGFGFVLEGYRRFAHLFPPHASEAERLVEIYRVRRSLDRIPSDPSAVDLEVDDRELLHRYFPDAESMNDLRRAREEFRVASDSRFAQLERGASQEVQLWTEMIQWSLLDFATFYDALDIQIDFVLGESFYFHAGNEVVDRALATGHAFKYTQAAVEADLTRLRESVSKGELTSEEAAQFAEGIRKDLGAIVVPVGDSERLVVRRKDGASIYATRDLGAIQVRRDLFGPSEMVYVVGQEQRVHFERVFKAAEVIGVVEANEVVFRHIYFGFYVDAKTGRKLSSRDSVANVNHLLLASIDHFRLKSAERGVLTSEELDETSKQLAIGSLVFNDLKQDVKGAVEIDTAELQSTIANFEKSGGAYVVYTACRARSILRKFGRELPDVRAIAEGQLTEQEALILLKIQMIPEKVCEAAKQANPTLLVRHLLDLAGTYNSYYARVQVIVDGVADPLRLLIARAVEQSLTNALRMCHIHCPEKI